MRHSYTEEFGEARKEEIDSAVAKTRLVLVNTLNKVPSYPPIYCPTLTLFFSFSCYLLISFLSISIYLSLLHTLTHTHRWRRPWRMTRPSPPIPMTQDMNSSSATLPCSMLEHTHIHTYTHSLSLSLSLRYSLTVSWTHSASMKPSAKR